MIVVLEEGVLANLLYKYIFIFMYVYTHTYVCMSIYIFNLDRPIGVGPPPAGSWLRSVPSVICPAGLRCSFLTSPYKPHYSAAEALSTLQIS